MRSPRPWQRLISWFIVGPALLTALAGVLILFWSFLAWLRHLPRIFSALPDWALGVGMMAGGFAVALSFSALATPSGSLPEPAPNDEPRQRGLGDTNQREAR